MPCSTRNSSSSQATLDLARAGGEELRHRHAFVGGVVRPSGPLLDHGQHRCGKVADVDELHRPLGGAGSDHRAAARHSPRPVHVAVRRIVRPDDEAGPNDERSFAEHVLRRALAERLQRPVVLKLLAEFLDALVLEGADRTRLRGRLGEIRVGGDRGDERVVRGRPSQRLRGGAHDPREVAARVDDRVPFATGERGQVAVPVAAQTLGLGEELGFVCPRLNRVTEWSRASAASTIARPRNFVPPMIRSRIAPPAGGRPRLRCCSGRSLRAPHRRLRGRGAA